MNIHRIRVLGLAAVIVLAVGCSDEQRRGFGEEDAREALSARVEQVADDQGLELDGGLDCTADIAAGSLTATCEGLAISGAAVLGTFTGTADVDAESCLAQLVVEIDDAAVVEEPEVDCFDVG